jgi:hypothetical protein
MKTFISHNGGAFVASNAVPAIVYSVPKAYGSTTAKPDKCWQQWQEKMPIAPGRTEATCKTVYNRIVGALLQIFRAKAEENCTRERSTSVRITRESSAAGSGLKDGYIAGYVAHTVDKSILGKPVDLANNARARRIRATAVNAAPTPVTGGTAAPAGIALDESGITAPSPVDGALLSSTDDGALSPDAHVIPATTLEIAATTNVAGLSIAAMHHPCGGSSTHAAREEEDAPVEGAEAEAVTFIGSTAAASATITPSPAIPLAEALIEHFAAIAGDTVHEELDRSRDTDYSSLGDDELNKTACNTSMHADADYMCAGTLSPMRPESNIFDCAVPSNIQLEQPEAMLADVSAIEESALQGSFIGGQQHAYPPIPDSMDGLDASMNISDSGLSAVAPVNTTHASAAMEVENSWSEISHTQTVIEDISISQAARAMTPADDVDQLGVLALLKEVAAEMNEGMWRGEPMEVMRDMLGVDDSDDDDDDAEPALRQCLAELSLDAVSAVNSTGGR